MRRTKMLAAGSAAMLTMLASRAMAQGDVNVQGTWTHRVAGVAFPEHLGGAPRIRVHEYSPDGADASAAYRLQHGEHGAVVTIYVYPVLPDMDCAATFADMERSIFRSYKDVARKAQDRWPSPSGHAPNAAYHASFTFTGNLDGKEQLLDSESYLFCPAGGKWLVSARASWAEQEDFSADFAALLARVDWPGFLDAP